MEARASFGAASVLSNFIQVREFALGRGFRMRIFVAAPLAVALSTSAAAATLHQYAALALSPAGDRIAALESDAAPDAATKPHARIVLRSASTGRVLSTLDPCRDCKYSGLEFAPDGRLPR